MSYQTPLTIKEALDAIQRQEYVLPAIQREFTWKPHQICGLFDSLMQGYPIGGFLFWKVEAERSADYTWYGFMREYHQRKKRHCPVLDLPNQALIAVLDGQQRLTSLNIGLRGWHAEKKKYGRWRNPDAYPEKWLYVNLKGLAGSDESNDLGLKYDFRFLTKGQAAKSDQDHHWFKVADVWGFGSGKDVHRALQPLELGNHPVAYEVLYDLFDVVHQRRVLPYFIEKDQRLDRVLDIFIRVNSAGTPLSYSDLLLSIATAQWKERNARKEIHELVDELNETGAGFAISKDLVLKAGLMLSDIQNVAFRVSNFTSENMRRLEEGWDDIAAALRTAVGVMSDFGFSAQTLAADSVMIPLSYYISRRGLGADYRTAPAHDADRRLVRQWICRSLVKAGVWGSGLDSLLLALRTALADADDGFPLETVEHAMTKRGKSLRFTEDEIEDLLDSSYNDRRTFALLSLMFPFVNLRHVFHADHVFPKALFTPAKLRGAGVPEDRVEDLRDKANLLANLQLLEGATNQSKQSKLPAGWLADLFPEPSARLNHCELHDLGEVPTTIADFGEFYDARRKRLESRLRGVLGVALELAGDDSESSPVEPEADASRADSLLTPPR